MYAKSAKKRSRKAQKFLRIDFEAQFMKKLSNTEAES